MDINRFEHNQFLPQSSIQNSSFYYFNPLGFLRSSFDDFNNYLLDQINKIFQSGLNIKEEPDDEIDFNELYFIKNLKPKEENVTNNKINDLSPQKVSNYLHKNKKIFKIESTESTDKKEELIHKKRRRGRKGNLKISKKKLEIHDAFSEDNLSRKIRVHFLNFCTSFINELYKYISKCLDNSTNKFVKLNNKLKINVNKYYKESLKNKTLGEIIACKRNDKCKRYDQNINKKIYEKFKNHELLSEIFSINYK